jgi:hypothetical protein
VLIGKQLVLIHVRLHNVNVVLIELLLSVVSLIRDVIIRALEIPQSGYPHNAIRSSIFEIINLITRTGELYFLVNRG